MSRPHMSLRSRFHPEMIILSALVWVLLWGELSLYTVLVGAVLGGLIGVVFPMPSITGVGRFRPIGLLRLVAGLIVDLVRSSIAVLIITLRFGHQPENAIVGVQLRSRSDLYLTQTAEMVSLTPGTLVVEARRSTGTLYLHLLDIHGRDAVTEATKIVLHNEARVIRAFGRRDEIAALKSGAAFPGAEAADSPSTDRGE